MRCAEKRLNANFVKPVFPKDGHIFKHLKMYNESRSHSYFAVCELDIAVRALDIAVRALDIALGNHALRMQPTDYSLICRYRLVNNL